MKQLPFVQQSNTGPGPASAQRLLNVYPEKMPEGSAQPFVLRPSPGMVTAYTCGTGPIRAVSDDLSGRFYAVSGGQFWRLKPDGEGGAGLVDTLDNNTNLATIAVGPVNGCVCIAPNAWAFDHTVNDLRPLGGTFPGATSVTYLDGYFVFTSTGNSSQFFISALLNAESTDPLDFAAADAVPNVVRRAITHNREVWLMGEGAIEVWYNAGEADFPLRPRAGGVVRPGTLAPKAVAIADGSVWWIGTDGIVYRSVGYQPRRVSTHAVERAVAQFEPPTDATMTSYAVDGHTFVSLTLDSDTQVGVTWVYDCATDKWHERSSGAGGIGPWRGTYAGQRGGFYLIGDASSGKLLYLDAASATDVGEQIVREVCLPELTAHGARAFMSRLEIEMEVGTAASPGDVQLSWSDNGGITWSPERTAYTGTLGEYRKRVSFTRLGSFRRRVLRLRCDGIATFWGADADTDAGTV